MPRRSRRKSPDIMIALLTAIAIGLWWWLSPRPPDDGIGGCYGTPRALVDDIRHTSLLLRNPGFDLGYSEFLANPLWVSYELTTPRFPPPESRPRNFRPDPRSLRGIDDDALRATGYQRGHLAPNYAMYRVHGIEAQQASFLMTNVSPQLPRLNQKAWQRLEEVIMDHLVPKKGALCVLTGPVFGATPRILPSGVAVPEAFFKILVTGDHNTETLAFLIPQKVAGDEPLDRFLVTVDEIERRTGLDFLHSLPDTVEGQIENHVGQGWGLEAVAELPARY